MFKRERIAILYNVVTAWYHPILNRKILIQEEYSTYRLVGRESFAIISARLFTGLSISYGMGIPLNC